ncbi:MAG TPA: VIT family protein [Patescibacteria group bacterium]|nr:VIT family protein [Patescibacteria group bacterium]
MTQDSKKAHASDNNSSSLALNKLRAAVLGANDGIVSISSVVMGVAGATSSRGVIFTAGMAALVAGALSMAVGEYVSVSSQSDAEKSYIKKEKQELLDDPDGEFEELVDAYIARGVNAKTARIVAKELTADNALKAHLHIEFNLDQDDISSPLHAAIASLLSFTVGGIIPFLTMIFAPTSTRITLTVVAVVCALALTGYASAYVGNASRTRAIGRVLIGGALAMAITYSIGKLFGAVIS